MVYRTGGAVLSELDILPLSSVLSWDWDSCVSARSHKYLTTALSFTTSHFTSAYFVTIYEESSLRTLPSPCFYAADFLNTKKNCVRRTTVCIVKLPCQIYSMIFHGPDMHWYLKSDLQKTCSTVRKCGNVYLRVIFGTKGITLCIMILLDPCDKNNIYDLKFWKKLPCHRYDPKYQIFSYTGSNWTLWSIKSFKLTSCSVLYCPSPHCTILP